MTSFIELITTDEKEKDKPIWSIKCKDGHGFVKNIKYVARTIFNLGATNYAAELNGQIHASRKRKVKENKPSSTERKISKLQSSK